MMNVGVFKTQTVWVQKLKISIVLYFVINPNNLVGVVAYRWSTDEPIQIQILFK